MHPIVSARLTKKCYLPLEVVIWLNSYGNGPGTEKLPVQIPVQANVLDTIATLFGLVCDVTDTDYWAQNSSTLVFKT